MKHVLRYWPFVGEITGHRLIPRTRANSFDVFFDLRLKKTVE